MPRGAGGSGRAAGDEGGWEEPAGAHFPAGDFEPPPQLQLLPTGAPAEALPIEGKRDALEALSPASPYPGWLDPKYDWRAAELGFVKPGEGAPGLGPRPAIRYGATEAVRDIVRYGPVQPQQARGVKGGTPPSVNGGAHPFAKYSKVSAPTGTECACCWLSSIFA